jgi:hypothetical protein
MWTEICKVIAGYTMPSEICGLLLQTTLDPGLTRNNPDFQENRCRKSAAASQNLFHRESNLLHPDPSDTSDRCEHLRFLARRDNRKMRMSNGFDQNVRIRMDFGTYDFVEKPKIRATADSGFVWLLCLCATGDLGNIYPRLYDFQTCSFAIDDSGYSQRKFVSFH